MPGTQRCTARTPDNPAPVETGRWWLDHSARSAAGAHAARQALSDDRGANAEHHAILQRAILYAGAACPGRARQERADLLTATSPTTCGTAGSTPATAAVLFAAAGEILEPATRTGPGASAVILAAGEVVLEPRTGAVSSTCASPQCATAVATASELGLLGPQVRAVIA